MFILKVSHHPPISAAHAEGRGWSWWQTFSLTTKKYLARTIENIPELPVRLKLACEDYTWNKV